MPAATKAGPKIEHLQLLDCAGSHPDTGEEPLGCTAAIQCPQNEGGPATAAGDMQVWLRMRQFQRQAGETPGPWELAGTRCVPVGGSDSERPSLLELVVLQWRQVRIPEPQVQVQPPGGRTLVNLDTIVFTDGQPQSWPVRLLGHDVQIRAVPVQFQWRFGDGGQEATDEPGAPYPDQTVWHVFTERGASWASVDVTFRGEFRVDGAGDWLPIPGQVTRPGARVDVEVVEQRTELVAGG